MPSSSSRNRLYTNCTISLSPFPSGAKLDGEGQQLATEYGGEEESRDKELDEQKEKGRGKRKTQKGNDDGEKKVRSRRKNRSRRVRTI